MICPSRFIHFRLRSLFERSHFGIVLFNKVLNALVVNSPKTVSLTPTLPQTNNSPLSTLLIFFIHIHPSYSPLNTKPTLKVRKLKDLRCCLQHNFNVVDNVANLVNKARKILLYLKRSFAALILDVNSPFY